MSPRILSAAALGALVALFALFFFQRLQTPAPVLDVTAPAVANDDPGLQYIRALQSREYARTIALTEWMQTRIQQSPPESRPAIEAELLTSLQHRTPAENELRLEGLEDPYLFATGALIKPLATDPGRTDLDQPIHHRTWFEITYPDPATAPLGPTHQRLHTLRAALNISTTGLILKANVIGNAEIDPDTLTTYP